MASSLGTLVQYPLGSRPAGWDTHRNHFVILTYDVDDDGRLIFSYYEGFIQGTPQDYLEIADLQQHGLSEKRPILDLEVYADCFLEIWLDNSHGKNWQWSLDYDAVTTKKDYSDFYFELTYRDGMHVYPRTGFPAGSRPMIARFGARYNAVPDLTKHGFSLNLDLLYDSGKVPITIDPDIQNPKV